MSAHLSSGTEFNTDQQIDDNYITILCYICTYEHIIYCIYIYIFWCISLEKESLVVERSVELVVAQKGNLDWRDVYGDLTLTTGQNTVISRNQG